MIEKNLLMIVSLCGACLKINELTTGIMLKDNNSDPNSANTIAIATGANNLPSNPSKLKRGIKNKMIIKIPLNTGSDTSFATRYTMCNLSNFYCFDLDVRICFQP